MKKLFGDNTALALCCSGLTPYDDALCDMAEDALLVKNMGFPEMCFWSYEHFINFFGEEGLEFYLESVEEERDITFYFNPLTGLLRLGTVMVDLVGII